MHQDKNTKIAIDLQMNKKITYMDTKHIQAENKKKEIERKKNIKSVGLKC